MIVALGFCPKDADKALSLLEWMKQLGDGGDRDLLLVLDSSIGWSTAVDVLDAAHAVFHAVRVVATDKPYSGWPQACNQMFLLAARQAKQLDVPFLWLEPDAIPIRAGWLSDIARAYKGGFMGHIYDSGNVLLPPKILSGIAVYPPNAVDLIEPTLEFEPQRAWDISSANVVVPRATHTPLIQHFWGKPDLAPTFVSNGDAIECPLGPAANPKPETALYHRNPDHTLLKLLQKKLGFYRPQDFMVVWPFCNKDAELALKNLRWMAHMGMPKTHEVMLSYEHATLRDTVSMMSKLAGQVFTSVRQTYYPNPRNTQFPQTSAWQHAARTMQQIKRDWLWMEADAIPLKKDWLTVLQNEYNRCGKLFMGPVVPGPGHMNGTGIYPADTPVYVPITMQVSNNAWDVQMRPEMIHLCHDCSRIFHHVWGVDRGRLSPLSGAPPHFPKGSPLLGQISKSAVVIHRVKDGSLIDRLMEQHAN